MRALRTAAVLLIGLLLLGRLWWMPAHASLNINEGWNAGHALRLFGGGELYPAPDALVANNYPPLSVLIVGAIGSLIGDHIVAGRLVSLCSVAATGGAVWVVVRRLAGEREWADASAALFAGFVVTLLRKYLAMNDPQWLAQAIVAWAMVLLTPERPGADLSVGRIVAAAALTVAAGLVKHNIVALPVAFTLWLALVDRRALIIWLVSGITLAAGACAALFAIWGANAFADVLAPARSYSLLRMAAHGAPLLLFVLPGLLASRPLRSAWREDRRLLLPVLMLAFAIPIAILQRSGAGVDINATFETMVALSVAVPIACARRRERQGTWFGLAALPSLALVPVALVADVQELAGRDAAVRHWQPFVARVAVARGPVACDDQALCYWAGKESALDFFATKQRLLKRNLPNFQAALDHGAFTLIAMRSENGGWHENRLIPAIRKRYRTIYVDDGYELLVPR